MADSWGGTVLNVTEYGRPGAAMYFAERELLPDPTLDVSVPQSVLQGFGRLRKRRKIAGYGSKSTVDSLEEDMYAMTSRTLTCDDGFSMTAIIVPGTFQADRKLGNSMVWYSVEFIET